MLELSIKNRRYTGSKTALLEDIYAVVKPYIKKRSVFADLFAGTGVVSAYMLEKGVSVIVNDILRSNYVAYEAWFGSGQYSLAKLERIIAKFNSIKGETLTQNYFSRVYGGTYFAPSDAKKIGYIRENIECLDLTKRERNILLASLMYATDKIANTVGHFEHYLSKKPEARGVVLRLPCFVKSTARASIYNEDANVLARHCKADIVYIDPPYNARQYVNFYHVLENLIRWEKPTRFEGKSMKFERNHLKSEYSRAKAPEVFADLIKHIDAKVIIVSYNNTYNAKSSASNNKISENEMQSILSAKGVLTKKEIKHKFFNSGKTDFSNHKEYLYICKVRP